METLQSVYNSYDEYIIGDRVALDHENFDLYVAGLQATGDPRYINIDLDFNGVDFLIYLKKRSQRISSSYQKNFLSEIKEYPDPEFFRTKNFKKINEIKEAMAVKYPQYKFFVDDIIEALEEIEVHLKSENRLPENNQIVLKNGYSNRKIKWLGQINVLTTLFYDLIYGQDKGMPLIECEINDIKNLLINNFVTSDGKELSKDTINTNLNPERFEKKAKRGDRIELGNVKQKNKL